MYRIMLTLQYNVRKNVYGKEESISEYVEYTTKLEKDEYSTI
jgi:hypothetical protein